jgi:hypothetical protein
MPSSYDFQRERVSQYRRGSIDSQKFHEWVRNDMYRSSYAHHHSPVLTLILRILLSHVIFIFLATLVLFLRTDLKVYMQKHLRIKPRMCSRVGR